MSDETKELWLGKDSKCYPQKGSGDYVTVRLYTVMGKPRGTVRIYRADLTEIAEALEV